MDSESMMAAEKKAQALATPELSKHHHHAESTISEVETCAFCGAVTNICQLGAQWICTEHLAASVSLAANDIWPNAVSYTREFEALLIW